MRHYFRHVIALFIVLVGLFMAFNVVVDPYDIGGFTTIEGLTDRKTRSHEDGRRVHVSHKILNHPAQSLILGSSRIVDGFESEYSAWPGGLYNAGIRGSNAFELAHLVALTQRRSDIKCLLIGFDISEFSGGEKFKSAFLITPLPDGNLPQSHLRVALSPNTFMRSVQTVHDNITGGSDTPPFKDIYSPGEQRLRFERVAQSTYKTHYGLYVSSERMDYLYKALETSAQNGTQIIGFIHPTHAWFEEASLLAGQIEAYQNMRRYWVKAFHQLNSFVPKQPCTSLPHHTLWDFSGFQSLATTSLPGPSQEQSHPYFHEPAHYLPETGQAMLEQILRTHDPESPNNTELQNGLWGYPLSKENIETSFEDMQGRRQAYLQTKDGQDLSRLINTYDGPLPAKAITPLAESDWAQLERVIKGSRKQLQTQP